MNYNPNDYVALGIGEIVTADCMEASSTLDPRPVHNHEVGTRIFEATAETYVRPIIKKAVFPSGATRSDATGRGRFDLIPYEAMLSLARRYEMGAVSFGDRNWERGQPLSRLLSSMRRHAAQINYDFREDHVGAVLWNAAAFVTMVERMRAGILPKELDDVGYFLSEGASK